MLIQKRTALLTIAIMLLILLADQALKVWVKTSMLMYERIQLAGDWAYLLFTENDGMAFGFDGIGTLFLALFRLAAITYLFFKLVHLLRHARPLGYIICVALVIAGALGNVIDNCFYGLIFTASTPYELARLVPMGEGYGSFLSGHVVDMFYFPMIDTILPEWLPFKGGERFVFFSPIFNLADAAISCGAVAIALFYRQELSQDLGSSKEEDKQDVTA